MLVTHEVKVLHPKINWLQSMFVVKNSKCITFIPISGPATDDIILHAEMANM